LIIDSGQSKDKSGYYHSLKTRLGGRSGAGPRLQVELTIDPDQYKDRSGYYHSFKI